MINEPSPQHRRTGGRGLAALLATLTLTAVACSDGESGTDIHVDGGGTAGVSSGAKAGKGGSNTGTAGSSMTNGGDGMGGDGGAGEDQGGSAGSQSGAGGNAGKSGSGGTGGTAAAGGMGGGGAAGTSAGGGMGGASGSGGMAGNGGMAGTSGTAGNAGTGTVVSCADSTKECEPAATPLCSDSCEAVSTMACVDCENAGDCFEFIENCGAFTGTAQALCYDVVQCIQDTNCNDSTGTLGLCFCGTVPAASCGSAPLTGVGSPNGACKDLIVEGLAPVATSAQVLGLLTATGRPAGAAMARLNCQKVANATDGVGACYDVCGFGSTAPFPPATP